jgi:hypothetical protein
MIAAKHDVNNSTPEPIASKTNATRAQTHMEIMKMPNIARRKQRFDDCSELRKNESE